MNRITSKDSPYTLLQQRLQFIARHPERSFTIFLENVPQWDSPLKLQDQNEIFIREYAPCNGYDFLIQALQERDQDKYGLDLQPEHVMVTNGAMHALSLIFRSLYKPGAAALVQAPALGSVADILKASGYEIVYFSSNHQGEVEIEQLERLYREDVQLVYINTPHNPIGDILSEQSLKRLVQFVQERGIALVTDMIYDSFTFGSAVTHSPLSISADWEHLYTVNSMSKNYGAPGLRIGWITSAADNIKRLSGLCESECVSISGLSQWQALALLQKGNDELVEIVNHRKVLIEQKLARMEQIEFTNPAGGTQFFVKLPVDDIDLFADFMLVEYGLALTTTSNYAGVEGSYIRIPLVYPVSTTERALELLDTGIHEYQRRVGRKFGNPVPEPV
jgi:aspartate aminotransferase